MNREKISAQSLVGCARQLDAVAGGFRGLQRPFRVVLIAELLVKPAREQLPASA